MDCVSGQNNRRLILSTTKINRINGACEDISSKNPALLAYIEGDFKIIYDDKVFLEDNYMCVLELAVQLTVWLKCKGDFSYDAISSEDKDILLFSSINESEFVVSSAWSESKAFTISKEELFISVMCYIFNIDRLLKKLFNIEVCDFLPAGFWDDN